jgi:Orsellinic acid/F9775 biosynthesis cluster protein D
MNPIPTKFQSLLRYDEQWHVLICIKHKYVVMSNYLIRHLRDEHSLRKKDYAPLILAVSKLPTIEDPKDLPTPLNDSTPIKDIAIYDGYSCDHCVEMLTTSKSLMLQHVFKAHPAIQISDNPAYRKARIQSWTHRGKYWAVRDSNPLLPLAATGSLLSGDRSEISWEQQMSRTEADRLQSQVKNNLLNVSARNAKDDTTPWLLRTKWPVMFSGKDITIIRETRFLRIENKETQQLVSTVREEWLRVLDTALDRIVKRATETLAHTPWPIRCWLRSPIRNDSDRRPFERTQEPSTEARYIGYWRQMLYYCFRTCRLDPQLRQRVYGIQFTDEQERLILEILELLSTHRDEEDDMDWDPEDDEVDGQLWESEEDSDQEVRGGAERSTFEIGEGDPLPMHTRPIVHQEAGGDNRLSEKLFELCITFLTQYCEREDSQKTPLLHFSAVLGIDHRSNKFRRATNYTPFLAGLIWVGQLLTLEYALPLHEYRWLGWPSLPIIGGGINASILGIYVGGRGAVSHHEIILTYQYFTRIQFLTRQYCGGAPRCSARDRGLSVLRNFTIA